MRAHRIGAPLFKSSMNSPAPPRTLICQLLRYPERDCVLQATRKYSLVIGDDYIFFSADYSSYTIARRCEYSATMESLKKLGYQAFILYPARLKITKGSLQKIFIPVRMRLSSSTIFSRSAGGAHGAGGVGGGHKLSASPVGLYVVSCGTAMLLGIQYKLLPGLS